MLTALYSRMRPGFPGHPGLPTFPGYPGLVEEKASTRRGEQTFMEIQVGQPFQDILVRLRWPFLERERSTHH